MSRNSKDELHSVRHIAMLFGVDRSRLQRKLEELGVDASEGVTFQQAYEALTNKMDADADRARRQRAEADSAEIDAAEKRGKLMLSANFVRWCKEFGTQVRAKIMGADYITAEAKKRLCGEMAAIELE